MTIEHEALLSLQRVAEQTPGDIVVQCRLGALLVDYGDATAAACHVARAAEMEPAVDDPWQWLYKAIALVRLHRVDEAEAILLRLLERNPSHVEATYHLVQLLIAQGRFAEAVPRLTAVIEPGPDEAASQRRGEFTDLVFQLAEKGERAAVRLLRTIVAHAPDNIVATYRLGEALEYFGEPATAEACFERAALTLPGPDPWQPLYRAIALVRTGSLAEAERVLKALLLVDKHPIETAYHLCRLLIRRNRLPEASAILAAEVESSIRKRRGVDRLKELAVIAVELEELGVSEATAVLEKLADQAPDDIVVRYRLATALARQDPSQAMSHFQRVALAETGPDATPRLCQASSLVRLGRSHDAESALLQLLALHPRNHEAVYQLSRLYLDHGRPAESLSLLASFVGTLRARGPVSGRTELSEQLHCLAIGGFQDAVPLLRQVADLARDDIPAQFRVADAASMFGDALDATRYFTVAADATPAVTDGWGWLYKALALQRLGRAGEAEAVLRYAQTLDSPPVEIAYHLAQLLMSARRLAEAADVIEAAIATPRPTCASLMPLATGLAARGVGSAEAMLQRIVESNTWDEHALTLFAEIAYDHSRPHEAIDYLARAQAVSDTALRRIDGALMAPYILSSNEDLPFWVDRFTRGVDALIGSDIQVEKPLSSTAGPPYLEFFMFGVNTRDLYRQAAHVWQAAHPALTWTAPHCQSWRRRPLNRRLRIGFYTQPTFPLVWGIARALDRNEFEVIHLYEHIYPLTRTPWSGAADRHVAVPNTSIADAQRVIAEQELDILVHFPYSSLRYFLSHARLAPLQCVLCEPCYTDGLANLDYYISWDSAEPPSLDEWYSCAVALMKSAPYWIEREYTRPIDVRRSEYPLPQEARWYACPSSPVKLHPQFDLLIARILAEDPDGVFVLFRGDNPLTQVAAERIRRAVGAAAHRVHVMPTFSEDRAHALLGLADCVLDAWPVGGMSSSFVTIHAGVPTVTLPENIPFGRWLATMYEAIGVTDLIASTPDEYVRLALRLASDPAWKAGLADRIRAGREVFVENHAAVREIESFLRAAVSAAHHGDEPRHWRNGRFAEDTTS